MVDNQTGRSWRQFRYSYSAIATGVCLILSGCAEAELGAQIFKSANRAATPAAQVTPISTANQPATPANNAQQNFTKSTEPQLAGEIDPDYRTAPEVFRASGVAKWDGARTLRGIWVAHPLAQQAMRVRIVNPATNRAADGALFRRDNRLSGPSLLVSSDAAQAIGLVPGQEQALEIYGLERAQVAESPLPGAISATLDDRPPSDSPEVVQQDSTPDTKKALAGGPKVVAAPVADKSAAPSTVIVETTEDGDAIATVRPQTAPSELVAASTPALSPPTPTPAEPAADQAAAPKETGTALAEIEAAVAKAEAQKPAAAAPTPVAEVTPAPAPKAEPEPETLVVAAATPTPETTPLAKRYIQVGVFGVPENATRLVKNLESRDIPAASRRINRSDGSSLQRVVAGPFETQSARDKALSEIKALGLGDARPVKG